MAEEKINFEVLRKLEEETRNKIATMQKVFKDLQAEPAKSPEELMKKIGDVKDVKIVAGAVKEMQDKIKEKTKVIEVTLKDIQKELDSLKSLKKKAQKEDVIEASKSIAASIRNKKELVEKAVKGLEGLKEEYTKKFFG